MEGIKGHFQSTNRNACKPMRDVLGGMATGRVFSYPYPTRGLDPAYLLNGFFSRGPNPSSQATSGPILQPLTVAQSMAQSIKKKIVFLRKKNQSICSQQIIGGKRLVHFYLRF